MSAPGSPNLNNVNTSSRIKKKWGIFTQREEPSGMSSEEKDKTIQHLRNELLQREALIEAATTKIERLETELSKPTNNIVHRKHPINQISHVISDSGAQKVSLATRGSLATANVLRAMPEPSKSSVEVLAERFISAFQNPLDYVSYIQSEDFASDIIEICDSICEIFEAEARCVFVQSPVYVIGDIHGNLEDLHFFADNLWKCGMGLTAGRFIFCGDYVDRGLNCLECVAYLYGLKVLYPNKIVLLRGNHETRSVNGWEEHYKEKSFLYQCKTRFGRALGENVWEEINQTFDRLPLAACIDHDIFCIHGGFPRPVPEYPNAIQAILSMPNVAAVNPCYDHETEYTQQIASDCIWSDPASEDMEGGMDEDGFGPSLRGGDCVCFGNKAIDNFLSSNNLSFIIRAHEAHAHGVSLSKSARVFTVFSTSKDHGQGKNAMAGCILVDFDKIQVITRSPAYKNKYVHHRTSIGCELSDQQLHELSRLGLVRKDSLEGTRKSRSRISMESVLKSESKNSEEKSYTHVVDFNSAK